MSHPYHATFSEEASCLACQRITSEERSTDLKAEHLDDLIAASADLLTFFGWASLPDAITPNCVIKVRNALKKVIADQRTP